MHLALPVHKPVTPTTQPMTRWSDFPAQPTRVPESTAPPPPRVPTSSPPPRTPYVPAPPRMKIPSIPQWPTQLSPSLRKPTVMPPSNKTCNLVIAPLGQLDPHHADLLPYHFANTFMNPTTGTEVRICDILAGRIDGQDGPTWREATCR